MRLKNTQAKWIVEKKKTVAQHVTDTNLTFECLVIKLDVYSSIDNHSFANFSRRLDFVLSNQQKYF